MAYGKFNATIIGRLTADPETNYTPNGNEVVNFNVAINRKQYVKGESVDTTEFIRCSSFAQNVIKYSSKWAKGDTLYVVGDVGVTAYKKRDGEPAPSINLRVFDVNLLSQGQREEYYGEGVEDDEQQQ